MNWTKQLKYNPLPSLLSSNIPEVIFQTKRDLLEQKEDINALWDLAEKVIKKQNNDGSFSYPNPKDKIRSKRSYDLLETYRNLGFLVEMYNLNKEHESIRKAKDFIMSFQAKEGDIRGIYWNQYSPNYTAGLLELLIKAGYEKDEQVKKALEWLLKVRQSDGGWAIPVRTVKKNIKDWVTMKNPIEPDTSKPFSWMVTGVVLRAFAYHPEYKNLPEITHAANLVLSRIFKNDVYPDRNTPDYWTKFTFPYWFSDLISVFDPIANLGFKSDDPNIKKGLDWLIDNQEKDGMWKLKMLKGDRRIQPYWLSLNICRIFKKFYDKGKG